MIEVLCLSGFSHELEQKIKYFRISIVLSLFLGLLSCSKLGDGSTPESLGFDSADFAKRLTEIREDRLRIHSFQINRNGSIALDARFYPYSENPVVHDIASVTKSVVATLIGIAIDKGLISNVEAPVVSFFPDRSIAELDDRKRAMTIRDLLMMKSGFDCGFDDAAQEKELYEMTTAAGNWVQYVLDLPMRHEPGEVWAYCSGNMHLLSAILQSASGLNAHEFAKRHLFDPLNIEKSEWAIDPQNITHGWGDLSLFPTDMAKLGELYLNNGVYAGNQVLSVNWVEETFSRLTTVDGPVSYGYGWWVSNGTIFYADGRGGQYVAIWPEKNIVSAITGNGYPVDRVLSFLLETPLADTARNEQIEASTQLKKVLEEIQRPVLRQVPEALPDIAKAVSGTHYMLSNNPYQLRALVLTFDNESQATMRIQLNHRDSEQILDFELPVGLEGAPLTTAAGLNNLPSASVGYWSNDNELTVEVDTIASINYFVFKIRFLTEDDIEVDLTEQTGLPPVQLIGHKMPPDASSDQSRL